MIDFAYNQYNEIGKKTVSMQRQEGHSQMKDKSETSTIDLIILFFPSVHYFKYFICCCLYAAQ